VDEGVPVISGQHLWGVMMEDNTFNYLTSEHAQKLSKAKVRRGDVIFTHAGSIGQAAFIPETSRYEEYVVSQRQFFMRCNLSKVTPLFMAMYFHSPDGRHKLLANTSSSGVPSIARPVTHLRSIEFTLPPIELQQDFGRLVSPMYDRIQANKNESLTLAALRDTLLPKLMRGEVKVKENSTAPINV
jgi:type I restriction enzyme S subunit